MRSTPRRICPFFVIHSRLDDDNRRRIEKVATASGRHTVEFIEFDFLAWCRKTPFRPEDFRPFRNTRDCYDNYSRLFLSQLFYRERGIPYLLYLDVDIVVNGSLDTILSFIPEIDLMGAVTDDDRIRNRQSGGRYINSGVLLLNLMAIDEFVFTYKALAYDQANRDHMKYFDQDIINGVVPAGRLYPLDCKYNLQDGDSPNLKEAVILHFTGAKPWNRNYMWRKKKRIWYAYHLSSWMALLGFAPGRGTARLIYAAIMAIRPLLNTAKRLRKHLVSGK
ncbi:MAG: hypothetical protein IJ523_09290 [Succinivibrionaceae bacterium]|nr:hypothetical protein [Succinivibrionaceae bacterium]